MAGKWNSNIPWRRGVGILKNPFHWRACSHSSCLPPKHCRPDDSGMKPITWIVGQYSFGLHVGSGKQGLVLISTFHFIREHPKPKVSRGGWITCTKWATLFQRGGLPIWGVHAGTTCNEKQKQNPICGNEGSQWLKWLNFFSRGLCNNFTWITPNRRILALGRLAGVCYVKNCPGSARIFCR